MFSTGRMAATKQEIPTGDLIGVYWVGCIGYSDETERQHGTSSVYSYVTNSAKKAFRPYGTVSGYFENFGLSKAY